MLLKRSREYEKVETKVQASTSVRPLMNQEAYTNLDSFFAWTDLYRDTAKSLGMGGVQLFHLPPIATTTTDNRHPILRKRGAL
jgi:hypothetical protein